MSTSCSLFLCICLCVCLCDLWWVGEKGQPPDSDTIWACCVCLHMKKGESTIWIGLLFYRCWLQNTVTDIRTSSSYYAPSSGSEHSPLGCTAEETRDACSRHFLTSVFLRSSDSELSELCQRTDNATAQPASPGLHPADVAHPHFHSPSCVHRLFLHFGTKRPGEAPWSSFIIKVNMWPLEKS